jgi:hypothetical protein
LIRAPFLPDGLGAFRVVITASSPLDESIERAGSIRDRVLARLVCWLPHRAAPEARLVEGLLDVHRGPSTARPPP